MLNTSAMRKMMKQESLNITLSDKADSKTYVDSQKKAMQFVIPREEIYNGTSHLFQGVKYGGVPISFFCDQYSPGRGPKLHKHPYEEVFVVEEGLATFTLDNATMSVDGGHVVIVPKDTPHKFINSGQGALRLVAIHCNKQTISEYLES